MRRWGYRPSLMEAIIALLLLACAWIVALPIMGIAGIVSPNPDEKVKGSLCLIAFAAILIIGVVMK